MYPLVEEMSEKNVRRLLREHAIFLFANEYSAKAQPPQHATTGARVEAWLNTQWQTEK